MRSKVYLSHFTDGAVFPPLYGRTVAPLRPSVLYDRAERVTYHVLRASAQLKQREALLRASLAPVASVPFTSDETVRMAYLQAAPARLKVRLADLYLSGMYGGDLYPAESDALAALVTEARTCRDEIRRIQTAARNRALRARKTADKARRARAIEAREELLTDAVRMARAIAAEETPEERTARVRAEAAALRTAAARALQRNGKGAEDVLAWHNVGGRPTVNRYDG